MAIKDPAFNVPGKKGIRPIVRKRKAAAEQEEVCLTDLGLIRV